MGLFRNEIKLVENLNKTIKYNNVKPKSSNGYDAKRDKLDEHDKQTVKQPVVVNGQTIKKSVLG